MKRSMFGTLPLVAAALLASCADPTGDLQKGATLRVSPGFLTVNVTATESVTVQLVDDQGNALPATYSAVSNNASIATVGEDVNFRPGLGRNRLAGKFGINALSNVDSTSVTFSAGGRSFTVPVLVAPLSIPVTLSPAAPNINDLVTVTAPGFLFHPTAQIVFGGSRQLTTAVAADSSSMTFRVGNGGTGLLTVSGVALGYLPALPQQYESAVPETFGPGITTFTGTDALATAPLILYPNPGETISITDNGVWNDTPDCNNGPGGFPCRIYKIVLTSDATFDFSSSWDNRADLGFYTALADNSSAGAACDGLGPGTPPANFEVCADEHLSAGTVYIMMVNYATGYGPPNNVDPDVVTFTLTGH